MVHRRIIKDEDPETGKMIKEAVRYEGKWNIAIEEPTRILIKLGEEELTNIMIPVSKGKTLHARITMTGVEVDKSEV